jgi:tetratricopeptide (TPR) repeat protein
MKLLLGCVIIAAGCFIAYSPAIKGDFIWDDDIYVTKNPLLPASDGLWRIWFSTDAPSQYFPLTYTTFWFEYRLWGLNPVPYHVANIAIHVISSLLLWLILRRLLVPAAFVVAAVFALHPVNVESVAWITERKNVLMLFFSLLSVFFWNEFALRSQSRRKAVIFYAFSILSFVLALFSKTTACVLPVILILLLWLKGLSISWKRLLQIAPYFVLAFTMGLLTIWWEKHHQRTEMIALGLGFLQYLLIASKAVWFYAAKIFLPVNLCFSYPRWKIDPADPLQYLWLVPCLLTAFALWFWRKRLGRVPVAAVLIFLAALFPMLGFFDLYTFLYTFVADHYQYMASIALITLVVSAGSRLINCFGVRAAKIAPVLAVVLLFTFGTLTWRQSRVYTNLEALWRDTLRKNPDSWLAHNNLSHVLLTQNKLDEAQMHLRRSIELAQTAPAIHRYGLADAYYNLALVFRAQQKYDDAVEQLRRVLDIRPNDREANFDLLDILESQGRLDEAVAHYNRFIKVYPDDAVLYYRFAIVCLRRGDLDNAVEFAQRAVQKTNRKNPVILNLLAIVYAAENNYDQAVATAEEALKLAADANENRLANTIRAQLESYKKNSK